MRQTLCTLVKLTVVLALCASCKTAAPAASTAAPASGSTEPATGEPGTATAPSAAGDALSNLTVDQLCDRTISMMEEMGQAAASNKDNCDGMGDALQAWVDTHRPFLEFVKAQDATATDAQKQAFEAACAEKFRTAIEKTGPMLEGISACAENAKVKAAMGAMGD